MRAPRTAAALLALALALPLSGCFGLPDLGDIADKADDLAAAADDLAAQAQAAADALAGIDYTKTTRVVVRDASTGETVREVEDEAAVDEAFSQLSEANGISGAPDAPAEYVIELWQPETLKLGLGESGAEDVKVLEVTTYEGSSVVTLDVCPIGLRLNLEASSEAADALRGLAA